MKRICASILASSLLLVISACHKSDNQELEPNVIGLTVAEAAAKLKVYGLVLGTETMASSGNVPVGDIISQTPGPGTSVDGGSAVNVIISSGPAAASQESTRPAPFGSATDAPATAAVQEESAAIAVRTITGSSGNATSAATGLTPGADGNFYGISTHGGLNHNLGAFFRITPRGAQSLLYSFGATRDDATQPDAPLIQGADGSFYGTSSAGGAYGAGTVYRITSTGIESVLYSFSASAGSDPANPAGGVIQGADGNFYGTTRAGGANGSGVLFRLTPAGALSVLVSFGPDHAGETRVIDNDMTR